MQKRKIANVRKNMRFYIKRMFFLHKPVLTPLINYITQKKHAFYVKTHVFSNICFFAFFSNFKKRNIPKLESNFVSVLYWCENEGIVVKIVYTGIKFNIPTLAWFTFFICNIKKKLLFIQPNFKWSWIIWDNKIYNLLS